MGWHKVLLLSLPLCPSRLSQQPPGQEGHNQRIEMLGTVTAKAAGADSGRILFCCADCSREL